MITSQHCFNEQAKIAPQQCESYRKWLLRVIAAKCAQQATVLCFTQDCRESRENCLFHMTAHANVFSTSPRAFCLSVCLTFCLVSTASSYRLSNVLPSAPDMSQLKHGVRSVAGKLSVMASGVVSSIQVSQIYSSVWYKFINNDDFSWCFFHFLFSGSLQFLSEHVGFTVHRYLLFDS